MQIMTEQTFNPQAGNETSQPSGTITRSNKSKEWLLTPEDVADRVSAKKSTVYSWVHQRKIPFLKVGGLLRFRLSDIEKWLEQQRVDVWEAGE